MKKKTCLRQNIRKKKWIHSKQLFYSSDPGCYELVNKTQVSTDVESGDPNTGYDIM